MERQDRTRQGRGGGALLLGVVNLRWLTDWIVTMWGYAKESLPLPMLVAAAAGACHCRCRCLLPPSPKNGSRNIAAEALASLGSCH